MANFCEVEDFAANSEPCVVAIGIFDALHLGHQKVLREALAFAKNNSAKLFALTFYPHPARVLSLKGSVCDLIYPLEIREKLLLEFGADKIFFQKFDLDFARKSPAQFLEFLRQKFPNLIGIFTGENFRFGCGASADTAWLKAHCGQLGIVARSVSGVLEGGAFVSSTRIRLALKKGDMQMFKNLAGRHYFCEGEVLEGKHLGREIGFPTLNIKWQQECKIPRGSYASILTNLQNGKTYFGVSNYGVNPTVKSPFETVETNLFDTPNFSVGAKIRVELCEFIRAEEKFANLDELKIKIAEDKQKAFDFFAKSR